jgi:uncharacterized protein YbaP (TraB family)
MADEKFPGLRPEGVDDRIGSSAAPSEDTLRRLEPLRERQGMDYLRRTVRPPAGIERAIGQPPAETAAMLSHTYAIDPRLAQRILKLEKQVAELTALLNGQV